jgi:twitching motility protein PilJ
MASGTEYAQDYQQAQRAYVQGNYEEAAAIVDRLVKDFPTDPSVCLLRGHIYCYGLQQYDIARQQYETVLGLTADAEFTNYANDGLSYITQSSGSNHSSGLDSFADLSSGSFQDVPSEQNGSDYMGATTWQDPGDEIDAFDGLDVDDLNFDFSEDKYGSSPATPSQDYGQFTSPFGADDYSHGLDSVDELGSFIDPFSDRKSVV